MNRQSYAVVIRTLGNGGDKYKQLLDSILQQTVVPEEIIVVIPMGYTLDYITGSEKVIYSEKGMIIQRAVGIQAATSDYILVVDDDVCFNKTFISDIFSAINDTGADVIVPAEEGDVIASRNYKELFKTVISNLKYIFIGQRFVLLNSSYRIKFAATGTCSINLKIDNSQYYKTQSWTFQCFFMNTEKAKRVKLENERWLENVGYAIYDDQVFAYKSFQQGDQAMYMPAIRYTHLDGGAGHVKTEDNVSRLKKKLYANAYNRTVFWYKFLYIPSSAVRRVWLICWYLYATINTFILYTGYSCVKKCHASVPFSVIKGAKAGFQYCRPDSIESEK
jgi:Glycosyltransferases involved in cell wall biogenesis